MNILIGSDLHGSLKYGKLFIEKMKKFQASKILLLGDLYYNGARNVPPEEYSSKDLVSLLNEYKDNIICVKGNCDAEVDEMVSLFKIEPLVKTTLCNKSITMSHGHKYNFENLPKEPGDIFIQGHTHISHLSKYGNLVLLNPGSVSLPKDGHHSYAIMNEKGISIYDLLDDSLLSTILF